MKPGRRLAVAIGSGRDRDLASLYLCPSPFGPFVESPLPCLELGYPCSFQPSLPFALAASRTPALMLASSPAAQLTRCQAQNRVPALHPPAQAPCPMTGPPSSVPAVSSPGS